MRPPSYYTSLANVGNSSYNHTTSSSQRNSSQQLRSSFSSPSSSAYASRTHLPFVPQSTLVAHCFTAVGSSTKPYGQSGSSYTATLSSGSPYSRSYTTSSYSSLHHNHHHHHHHHNPSLSTKRPTSSLIGASSGSASSSAYSSASNSSSSFARPSYLSPASASSTRSTYRPSSAASSSYYKPIRLRERPILTQISHQLHQKAPVATTTSSESSSSRPIARTSIRTSANSIATELKGNDNSSGDQTQTPCREAVVGGESDDETWSRDVARNISRNKYLIKFREIDKRRPSALISDSSSENQTSDNKKPDEVIVSSQVNSQKEAEPHVEKPVECLKGLTDINETILPTPTQDKMRIEHEPSPVAAMNKGAAPEPPTKVPANGGLANEVRACDTSPKKLEAKSDEPPQQKETTTTTTKKRRNIKLKLKPVATGAKESKETNSTIAGKQQEGGNNGNNKEGDSKQVKLKRIVKRVNGKSESPAGASSPDETKKKSETAAPKKVLGVKQPTTNEPSKVAENKSHSLKVVGSGGATKRPQETATSPQVVGQSQEVSQRAQPNENDKAGKRIRFRDYHYEDFNFLSVLGHGGWGFVILAELKDHDSCFAVKCIKKITIVEDDDYDSIMIERKVLTLGNVHPFICKLFCTFETEGYLFFVMEYCAGGDLMFHVQHDGKFTESRCRFYAAEIICAIRFLHNQHIIYRDLKLDNILLDSKGHIRLVDFGMCQCRTYREEMLPSNFCGTPEYISPEIIKGVPYNHSVDWWSFGVLLYEMAVGKMPFRGNDENELLWNVCYEQIHYPMFLTKELTTLLQMLLEREPTKRMGMATCKAGDIYEQPFFRGVDWKAVEEMRVKPPFVPQVNSKRDVQNFDTDFTESACELSPVDDDTLAKIDQKQFHKFPYTNPNIFVFN